MNTGDALLNAVLSDQTDHTCRLAFADWLDENDHPKPAEFVRLGVERSRILAAIETEGHTVEFLLRLGDLAKRDTELRRTPELEEWLKYVRDSESVKDFIKSVLPSASQ